MAATRSRRQFTFIHLFRKTAVPVAFLILSIFFQIVALATPYWSYHRVYKEGTYDLETFSGLWKTCDIETKHCKRLSADDSDPGYLTGWLGRVRQLEVFGTVALILAAILMILNYVFCLNVSRRLITWMATFFSLLAGILIVTGDTIYYSQLKFADYLDISYGLSIAAGGISLVDSVFLLGVAQTVNQSYEPITSRDRMAIYRKKHNYLTLDPDAEYLDTDSSDELRDMTGYRNPLESVSFRDEYETLIGSDRGGSNDGNTPKPKHIDTEL